MADDAAKAPPAPDGWQHVIPQDRTYQFLFPKDPQMIGYTSRKFTVRGIRAEVQMNYCRTRDDVYFDVEGATLTGRGVSGLKVDDMFEIMLEGQKQQRFTVSESKETTIGKAKARECRMRKDNVRCRAVLLVNKNRVIQLRVMAADDSMLDSDRANAFFQSLTILKDSPTDYTKEEAAESEQRAKEAMEKFGFKWTLKTEEMFAPEKPVIGLIHGREFKPDSIVLETGGTLRFRQGDKQSPDGEVRIVMFASPKDKFDNRTIEVNHARKSGNAPTILLSTKDPGSRTPKTSSFDKYAMKLSFGAKGPGGMVPCTIYLCSSDADKSFMAGKFRVMVK
jgi:hypothetical protein